MKQITVFLVCIFLLIFSNAEASLIGRWSFDGSVTDVSGNEHHGIVHGATLTTGQNGIPDSAYSFDGIDDYLVIPDDSDLDGMANLTLSTWIFPKRVIGYNHIMAKYDTSGAEWEQSYGMRIHDGEIQVNYYSPDGYTGGRSINANLELNTWSNITSTMDNGSFHLFINGNEVLTSPIESGNYSGTISESTTPVMIGAVTTASRGLSDFFYGFIDDSRVYDHALQEIEIQELYVTGAESPPTPEPTTMILFSIGLLSLAGVSRKK